MMMTIAAVAAVTQIVCEREGGSASGTLPLLLAAHGRTGPGLLEPGLLALGPSPPGAGAAWFRSVPGNPGRGRGREKGKRGKEGGGKGKKKAGRSTRDDRRGRGESPVRDGHHLLTNGGSRSPLFRPPTVTNEGESCGSGRGRGSDSDRGSGGKSQTHLPS